MEVSVEIVKILDEILQLGGRAAKLSSESPLFGAIPELDSMAVVAILTSIEERFGLIVEDDELDGAVFATVGTLAEFVNSKLTT